MNLRAELTQSITRFRTTSVNHPIGFIWKDNTMTFYQSGKRWVMSKVFHSCYMPGNCKGILLPRDIKKLLLVENKLMDLKEDLIIVPKEFGFDLLLPNEFGDPLLIEEVRFYSIKNSLILFFMKFVTPFKGLLKNINDEFKKHN